MKLPFLPRTMNAISGMMVLCSMTGASLLLVALPLILKRAGQFDLLSVISLVTLVATIPFFYAAAVWYHKRFEKRLQDEASAAKDHGRNDRTKNGPTQKRKR